MASTNVTGLFLMWSVMMVAMMMVLFYARVGRKAAIDAEPFTPTGLFAVGYLLVWFGFALAATGAHSALERDALLTTSMGGTSNIVGSILLIMAGLYQWSPLKATCLAHCQAPLLFIQGLGGFRRNLLGALEIGVWHGAYCIGCCWVLMTLLFIGGVMNMLWITAPGWHLRIESQVRSWLLSTGISSEVSAATQIHSPLTWAARINPIWRVFPSALNVSPTATLRGGVNPSHGRVAPPVFIWTQAVFPSIATTD